MIAGEGERSLEQAYVDWAYERLDAMVAKAAAPLPDVFADIGGRRSSEHNRKGRLKMLSAARDHDRGLVTGRLDEVDGDTFYIGRCHVDGENGEPAVVDWRADLGERFNQANHTDPRGIGRRRSFLMRRRVVEAVDDDILVPGFRPPAPQLEVASPPEGISVPEPARPSEPVFETVGGGSDSSGPGGDDVDSGAAGAVTVDGALTADAASADLRARDLLLAELEASRSGEMHDVVATIQGDQDRLIRADPAVPLLIQGGPGTGKTVVGLHRAAWVLYEQRRQVGSESVLVVGPNARFLDYIRNVLPSLGESSARQTTLDELAVTALPPAQREQIEIRADEGDTAARIKAGQAMARLVAKAIRLQARPKPLSVSHGLYNVELSEHEVTAVIDQLFSNRPNYRAVQAQLVSALSARFIDLFNERALARQGRAPLERERAAFMEAATQALAGERQAILPNLEAPRVVNRLFTEPDLLRAASTGVLEPDVLGALTRPRGGPARWTSSDLPLLDEAQHLISGEATSYSHVVVDEAQDLSPMQWRMVLRRAQRASLTILGDIAQGTAAWAPTRWEQVLQACGLADRAAVGELTLGYRIPAPVSEFACRLLPEIAPGIEAPTSFREGDEPMIEKINGSVGSATARVSRALKASAGTTAVIGPARLVQPVRAALDQPGVLQDRSVSVLEAHEAKGLEFDLVIVLEPAEIAGATQRGLRALFVALTRATKHLLVLTSTELPGALRDASPDGVAPFEDKIETTCACGFPLQATWSYCPGCGEPASSGHVHEAATIRGRPHATVPGQSAVSEGPSAGLPDALQPDVARDLARWAERRQVGSHKTNGRADPDKCTCNDQACLKAQAAADHFKRLAAPRG